MERVSMRLEVLKAETIGELNRHFRLKVQLQEQLDENEVQIHFKRGIMEGLERARLTIAEIAKSDKIEALRKARVQNDHKEVVKV